MLPGFRGSVGVEFIVPGCSCGCFALELAFEVDVCRMDPLGRWVLDRSHYDRARRLSSALIEGQLGHADQVVGDYDELSPHLVPCYTAVAQLSTSSDRPFACTQDRLAEYLLNTFPSALAKLVTGVTSRPTVYGRAAPLGYMRRTFICRHVCAKERVS